MGGLGSWWGTRPEGMDEDSAERREREAWVPRQEPNWTSCSYFKLGLLEERGSHLSGREAYLCGWR